MGILLKTGMENTRPRVIASALIEKDGKFMLTKEVLRDKKEWWIIPGGKVEFGENLIDAVKREMREEINLDIEILRLIDFKEVIKPDYNYHSIVFFFLAKAADEHEISEDHIIDAKFFSKYELKNMNLVESARWLFEKHFWE